MRRAGRAQGRAPFAAGAGAGAQVAKGAGSAASASSGPAEPDRTWQGEAPPPMPGPGPLGWALVLGRGAGLVAVLALGVAVHVPARLAERAAGRAGRPLSGRVTQAVCRASLRVIGLRLSQRGQPLDGPGAIMANHGSWLDVFVLNAACPVTFVSKAEVRHWPGIGHLARLTGTLFIRRARRETAAQVAQLKGRLARGERLVLFPEGTSSDSQRVLPFRSSLFGAVLDPGLREHLRVQPVTLRYQAPAGADARFYGWWGDMTFGGHLMQVLARPRQGRVELVWHAPVAARDWASRKELARHCEATVRAALEGPAPGPG